MFCNIIKFILYGLSRFFNKFYFRGFNKFYFSPMPVVQAADNETGLKIVLILVGSGILVYSIYRLWIFFSNKPGELGPEDNPELGPEPGEPGPEPGDIMPGEPGPEPGVPGPDPVLGDIIIAIPGSFVKFYDKFIVSTPKSRISYLKELYPNIEVENLENLRKIYPNTEYWTAENLKNIYLNFGPVNLDTYSKLKPSPALYHNTIQKSVVNVLQMPEDLNYEVKIFEKEVPISEIPVTLTPLSNIDKAVSAVKVSKWPCYEGQAPFYKIKSIEGDIPLYEVPCSRFTVPPGLIYEGPLKEVPEYVVESELFYQTNENFVSFLENVKQKKDMLGPYDSSEGEYSSYNITFSKKSYDHSLGLSDSNTVVNPWSNTTVFVDVTTEGISDEVTVVPDTLTTEVVPDSFISSGVLDNIGESLSNLFNK